MSFEPLTPHQIEFLAEDEEITIIPNFKLGKLDFISVRFIFPFMNQTLKHHFRAYMDHFNLQFLQQYHYGLLACLNNKKNVEYNLHHGFLLVICKKN